MSLLKRSVLIVVSIGIFLGIVTAVGVLRPYMTKKPTFTPQPAASTAIQLDNNQSSAPALPVINPESQTALRYYATKTAAIDFRDGAEGDFPVAFDKQSQKISWQTSDQIIGITISDLGRLDDLTDHTLVFSLSADPQATISGQTVQPVANPFRINDKVAGFISTINAGATMQAGHRYTIEVRAVNSKQKLGRQGLYTFRY